MHQLIPRRNAVWSLIGYTKLHPYEIQTVAFPIYGLDWTDTIEVDNPALFYQTHGRLVNDCCHSKLWGLADVPNPIPPMIYYNGTIQYTVLSDLWGWNGNQPWTETSPDMLWATNGFTTRFHQSSANTRSGVMTLTWQLQLVKPYSQNDTHLLTRECTITLTTKVRSSGEQTYAASCSPTIPDLDLESIKLAWSQVVAGVPYRTSGQHGPSTILNGQQYGDSLRQLWLSTAIKLRVAMGSSYGTSKSRRLCEFVPIEHKPDPKRFLLHEWDIVAGHVPAALVSSNDFSGYWRSYLVEEAYLSAVRSVPRLNENNIQNICEVVHSLKAMIVDKRIEIPRNLSSAWLAYRYSYGTSKADIEQAVRYVSRHANIDGKWFSCYGQSSCVYENTTITCICTIDIRNKELGLLQSVCQKLDEYGLSPSFYTFWDSLPFSFVVDWFIPIGDVLSAWDAKRMYSEERYDIKNISYSFSYVTQPSDGCVWHNYTRIGAAAPPNITGFYELEPKSVSDQTIAYRIIDGAALTLRR